MTHTGRVVFDDSLAARKWGAWCDGCGKMIGACTSEADARAVLENHERWQEVRAKWTEQHKTAES